MNSVYIGSIPGYITRKDILSELHELGFRGFKVKGKPSVDRRYLVLQTKDRQSYQSILDKEVINVRGVELQP